MSDGANAFEQLVIDSFREIKKSLAAVGEVAQQSYQQAAKTNGTVADLTRWREQIDAWRAELEVDRVTAVAFDAGAASVWHKYLGWAREASGLVTSGLVKVLAAMTLVTAGFTLGQIRDWWPW